MMPSVSHSGRLGNSPQKKEKLETTMNKMTTAVLGLSLMLGSAAFAAQATDKKADSKPAPAAASTTVKKHHKKHKKSSNTPATTPATNPPAAK
jgi:hypothetical protein